MCRTANGQYKSSIWNGKRPADGRRRYKLGIYASARDAALAYDRAAIAIKGKLALTNFPPPPDICRQDPAALRRLLEAKALSDSEQSAEDDDEFVGCQRHSPIMESPAKKHKTGGEPNTEQQPANSADAPAHRPPTVPAKYMGVWRKPQVRQYFLINSVSGLFCLYIRSLLTLLRTSGPLACNPIQRRKWSKAHNASGEFQQRVECCAGL